MNDELLQKEEALKKAGQLFHKAAALGRIINKHILFWMFFGGIPAAGICVYIKLTTAITLPWFIPVALLLTGPTLVLSISFLTVLDVIDLPNKIKSSRDNLIKTPEEREMISNKREKKGLLASIKDLRSLFKFDFKTLFSLIDLSGGIGSLTAMLSPLFYILIFISVVLNFLTAMAGLILLIVVL